MNTKARKVMIIGAGNVGASAAYALLNQNICEELILVDLNTSRAEAHAQDLSDAYRLHAGHDDDFHPGSQRLRRCRYRGYHRFRRRAQAGSNPAGRTDQHGKNRQKHRPADDARRLQRHLFGCHQPLRHHHLAGVAAFGPAARYRCWVPASGWTRRAYAGYWPRRWISARKASTPLFLASMAIPSFRCGHTRRFTAPPSPMFTKNIPVQALDRELIAEKVRKLGFEIYAGKGCTEYGVAGTIAEICRNIFTGSHRALAVSCILDGEYGVTGAAAGVPAVLTQSGVQQIIELQLVLMMKRRNSATLSK